MMLFVYGTGRGVKVFNHGDLGRKNRDNKRTNRIRQYMSLARIGAQAGLLPI